MSGYETRLYTWVDVEKVLRDALRPDERGYFEEGELDGRQEPATFGAGTPAWPVWLAWAEAYWHGLTLAIRPGTEADASAWLADLFGGNFEPEGAEGNNGAIRLESHPANAQSLPVLFETTFEPAPQRSPRPTFARPILVAPPSPWTPAPEPFPPGSPPVIALHSFKGGVGRTVSAIGLARALVQDGRKVLLVDADLEAPGVTWLIESRFPSPPISLADLLALVHGDPNPQAATPVVLAADRLVSAYEDSVYFLPAFRHRSEFASLEIRPENLVAGNPDPYVLARALAAVGKRLGVAAVIVDLRAGLSEAAAGILLDPRVHRVLVTTLSAQSVSGTEMMLRLLARTSRPERMDHPVPQIIVSQIPAGEEFKRLLEETAGRLRLAAEPFLASSPARPGGEDEATPQDLLKMDLIRIPFAPPLIALAPTWQDAVVQVEQAGIARSLIALRDWLPSPGSQRLATATAVGEQRKLLQETASRYVFAEAGEGTKFLATGPLRRLASDHQSDLPRVVVVGAKGSGKTYTFLHLVRRGSWGQFVTGAGVDWAGSDFFRDARFFPLLESPDLADVVQEEMQGSRIKVARRLGLGNPPTAAEVMSRVRSKLRQNLHEGEWTREWLELIGWGLGSASELESCFAALVRALRASGQAVVICLDGLEVLFDQAGESESQTTALQALFRDVPTQLAREAGRPVGLITFARQDLVLAAVRQNVGQLLDRYKPYALQWNREEALRLVYWTAREAGCLPENTDQAPESSLDGSRLAELLVPLWGRKLGSDRSKEGRSTDWVIAALSNLHGEVQARDLMRMLSEAARLAQQDGQWLDRILPPQSIRNAMVHCSQEKIGEVRQETPALRAVLDRLKILSPEERQLPLVAEHAGLHSKEVALLESHGLVLRVGEELFMPELFRLGLGFTIRARGRARVLSLLRQAQSGRG